MILPFIEQDFCQIPYQTFHEGGADWIIFYPNY